ncbi:hypothetical protein [Mucilaginibacter celer]|uniref:Uncharacterized protein n=1 Tax=Mucilaginibacter celer TaxID=2305508 RepID=A0A494VPV6_9SPHI|nr:hypothetical protein [Mucilaginibacter celer]AYL95200.1 hypothetical protein HYN43_007775 [Mucilaginibacter celer]
MKTNGVINIQVMEYLFDLRNVAIEHGFKQDKPWQLKLVSKADKIAIEKQYRVSVFAEPGIEQLARMLNMVETALSVPLTEPITLKAIHVNELQYLVAYNPLEEWR